MNILYINHYAGSLEMGMEFRPYYLAHEWQKMGHKVRIVAADYSHLRKQNPKVKKDFEIQHINGIEYQWVKTGRYNGNGSARAMTMLEFCGKLSLKAGQIAKDFQPDAVISSSTYPLDTYPAQRISAIAKCRYIHEAHDLWPLTLTEIGGMSARHPFIVLLAAAERAAYSSADKVVSLFPDAYKHMLKHGMQSMDKYVYIPNGIVVDDWDHSEPIPEEHRRLPDKLKKEGRFIVMYLGGHALSNSLDVLIDSAEFADSQQTAFILVGKGVEKERLISKSQKKNLSNVYFLPPVSKLQVPEILKEADALYIGAKKSPLYKYGVSLNKVYDYMMSGRPIIYGVEASNNDVKEADCGITIKPDDPQEVIKAIRTLNAMSLKDREELGQNGKKYVLSKYDYSKNAKIFIEKAIN